MLLSSNALLEMEDWVVLGMKYLRVFSFLLSDPTNNQQMLSTISEKFYFFWMHFLTILSFIFQFQIFLHSFIQHIEIFATLFRNGVSEIKHIQHLLVSFCKM